MSSVRYQGKVFMYPCAGQDICEPIRGFGDQFDTFLFVDITYRFLRFRVPEVVGWSEVLNSATVEGPLDDSIQFVELGSCQYREILPAWRRSQYRNLDTGRLINVVFRRGFGQYALHEVTDGTLGMFLHRGDSGGEGGSNTYFLANRQMKHEPISRLMDAVKRKLGAKALVGSDGSNTTIRQLVDAAGGDDSIRSFIKHGLEWVRVGGLTGRSSMQTVIWQVSKIYAGSG